MATIKRLKKEYEKILEDKSNISASPIDEKNFYEWKGTIIGPKDTPYDGGKFNLKIIFPDEYPYRPPKIFFETRIYHPNINSKGNICLDILRDKWSPSLTVRTVLLSISSLMDLPNAEDPLVPEIAKLYKNDLNKFKKIAREWTLTYAS